MPRARKSVLVADLANTPQIRICEHPSCALGGDFRAPKARDQLNEYRWFCLEHVREYNSKWDYYAGMAADEIEAHMRADTTWRRPSWPLGARSRRQGSTTYEALNDPYGLFEEMDLLGSRKQARARAAAAREKSPLSAVEQEALEVLELAWPVTRAAVKSRYKELAKKHHPDANGGDREAEERLKEINRAYTTLKACNTLPAGP
jgi:hypothetical protein